LLSVTMLSVRNAPVRAKIAPPVAAVSVADV
jgi:hypothetical protein